MAGVQAAGDFRLLAQRSARGAGGTKPRTDLHGPGAFPLTRSAARECQVGLVESDVFADLEADAPRAPFPRIGLVMRMAGDTDHSIQQVSIAACEIIFNDFIALPAGGRAVVVARQAGRFHEVLV